MYDTLFGTDEHSDQAADGRSHDRIARRHEVHFHSSRRPPLARRAAGAVGRLVESLKRWGKKDRFGQLLMAHIAKIAPVDKKTFTLELAERFGPVLEALGKPSSNVPFMMPARIASTLADEQIKEVVGSGPFKFAKDEWQPGEQAVYVRNPDYVPRDEPPSGSTGGKKAYLDKVIWRYIPDPWDAAEDLAAGEVDWWEQPPLDSSPRLNRTRIYRRSSSIRSGRRAGSGRTGSPAVQQQEGAPGAAPHDGPGDVPRLVHRAVAILSDPAIRSLPAAALTRRTVGAEPMMEHDLTKARQLVKESGYDGRPIVVLHVTDISFLNAAAVVTRQRLESIGFNVILRADGLVDEQAARARKDP